MARKPLTPKLWLITTLAVLVLISIAVTVQFYPQAEPSNIADVNKQQESSNSDQTVAEKGKPIGTDASTKVIEENSGKIAQVAKLDSDISAQVSEEKPETLMKSSSNNQVLPESQVSRGNNTANPSNTTPDDTANFWPNRKTWLQPVKGQQIADPSSGARYFGASRANGRVHAAIDFIAPGGTPVYAMTDGKVIRTSVFFQNTSAVEVQNTDGTIARYCEIAPLVSVGTMVHRGDVIGKIMTNYAGTAMLHLEMYMGTARGSLSQNNTGNYMYVPAGNYQRRSDLVDPTGAIYLPVE